jgi:hypothetical protein
MRPETPSGAQTFGAIDQRTQGDAQGIGQALGGIDVRAHLPGLDVADLCAMHASAGRKLILREAHTLPLVPQNHSERIHEG